MLPPFAWRAPWIIFSVLRRLNRRSFGVRVAAVGPSCFTKCWTVESKKLFAYFGASVANVSGMIRVYSERATARYATQLEISGGLRIQRGYDGLYNASYFQNPDSCLRGRRLPARADRRAGLFRSARVFPLPCLVKRPPGAAAGTGRVLGRSFRGQKLQYSKLCSDRCVPESATGQKPCGVIETCRRVNGIAIAPLKRPRLSQPAAKICNR
jgi:hypothetical protein